MDKKLDHIRCIMDESEDEARDALGRLDVSTLGTEDLLSLGPMSEKLGMLDLAISVYNHVLESDPENIQAMWALVGIRTDQGDWHRAKMLLSRLEDLGDQNAAKQKLELSIVAGDTLEQEQDYSHSTPFNESSAPASDADVMALCELFSSRQGVHARQWCSPDGRSGYSPVRQALTPAILHQHLAGLITVGVYVLRLDNSCCFLAFDLDVNADTRRLAKDSRDFQRYMDSTLNAARTISKKLSGFGLTSVIENSGGKGHHVWTFFKEPIAAAMVRTFGLSVLASVIPLPDGVSAEVFPVQGKVKPGGLGNLIKLPMGIHQRSGRQSVLLDTDGRPLSDPVGCLLGMPRLEKSQLIQIIDSMPQGAQLHEFTTSELDQNDEQRDDLFQPQSLLSRDKLVPTEPPYYLDEDAELIFLLERCASLRRLVAQARAAKPLTHNEQSLIIYTLGHLSRGADAVNELFLLAGHPAPLKRPLRGHPTSCRKIRVKLGISPGDEQCRCAFDPTLGSYEHPMLHLSALRAEKKLKKGADMQVDDEERLRLDQEIARLRTLRMRLDESGNGQATGTDGADSLPNRDADDGKATVIPFPLVKPKKDGN